MRADALQLPLAGESFDVVYTRSVLIYVQDKAGAIRELHRVLKPGGRASIFEPINDVGRPYHWSGGRELAPILPEHERIVEYLKAEAKDSATMLGFDERDLVHWFVDAGFASVRLTYELSYDFNEPRSRAAILAWLQQRPNPGLPSYEEGARAVLGDPADDHLARFVELVMSQPGRHLNAVAYITAVR